MGYLAVIIAGAASFAFGAAWYMAVLHRSAAARNAPYPRRISGGAFETGAAKFGHPVEYADANLGFVFLIAEGARL